MSSRCTRRTAANRRGVRFLNSAPLREPLQILPVNDIHGNISPDSHEHVGSPPGEETGHRRQQCRMRMAHSATARGVVAGAGTSSLWFGGDQPPLLLPPASLGSLSSMELLSPSPLRNGSRSNSSFPRRISVRTLRITCSLPRSVPTSIPRAYPARPPPPIPTARIQGVSSSVPPIIFPPFT
jgi:hypothetical protein